MNLDNVLDLYSTQFFWLCEMLGKEQKEIEKKNKELAKKSKRR